MKVYLAAMFSQKMEMRVVRVRLEKAGHECTAQWVWVEEGVDTDAGPDRLARYAQMGVDDVLRSDVLLAFSQKRTTMHMGGGRHVEFGVALQRGIPIIVVGPFGEHIFHYAPRVHHVDDLDGALAMLEMPGLLLAGRAS